MSIPLDSLKSSTLANMEMVLKKLPGDKYMLIEPGLLRAMDRTVSMHFLSSLGVKKVFKIQELPPELSFSRLVYVISPTRNSVQTVLNHVEVDRKEQIKRTKLIAFVPKHTVAMKSILESSGALGNDLQITDLSFGWIPIDVDLISLNLPEVFTNYFLHGDTAWPYHFGQMLGHVLETVLPNDRSLTDINLHAFGSAAQVSAAGLSTAIGRIRATKSTNPDITLKFDDQDSTLPTTSHRPLFILFSRNMDYITPFMVPTTFEGLIHEVIGINNGIIELPNVQKDDAIPAKINLSSSNISSFKEVRNAHISSVHKWLQTQRSQLEDSRTGLGFSLAALDRNTPSPGSNGLHVSNVSGLSDISTQLKPILAVRKELTILFLCLEEVMRKMANEERVEDLLSAQTEILQSGSGGALAMPSATPPSPTSSSISSTGSILSNSQQQQAENVETMLPEAATGTCADDASCQPVRLALEWLSTRFGDRVTEAVRMFCLLSITHDGLSEELYAAVIRHIQHAVGFSIYPMLMALARLRLLYPRRASTMIKSENEKSGEAGEAKSTPRPSVLRRALAPAGLGGEKLANATERLIKRRKSLYNRLHRQLQLSMRSQVNLGVEKPAVSPAYVFGGQHVPIVVRFTESLWAQGLLGTNSTAPPTGRSSLLTGPELLSKEQLNRALTLLHTDERSAMNLGRVSLESKDGVEEKCGMCSHGQIVVVAFVGGCTYAEVAALRFAASRRCWRLLIATSQILSTKSIIHQVGQAAAL
nr:Vacuolar protein sorting associated protein [Hymenolepis microstoma]